MNMHRKCCCGACPAFSHLTAVVSIAVPRCGNQGTGLSGTLVANRVCSTQTFPFTNCRWQSTTGVTDVGIGDGVTYRLDAFISNATGQGEVSLFGSNGIYAAFWAAIAFPPNGSFQVTNQIVACAPISIISPSSACAPNRESSYGGVYVGGTITLTWGPG